jgi:nitrogen fixation protein FixH
MSKEKKLTGWHVLGMFVVGFGVIISVNLTLAYNAVRTFPGIEVKNSYVASQKFDENRSAQNALNWDVEAQIVDGSLNLSLRDPNGPVEAEIVNALFGRATHTGQDQNLMFKYDGEKFIAPVVVDAGNWNLRLVAMAPNGTVFQQRIVLRVKQ